jgi:hypothetical protein
VIAGILPVLIGGLLLTGLFYTELHSLSWLAVALGSAAFATGVIITIMTIMITALWFALPGRPPGHPAPRRHEDVPVGLLQQPRLLRRAGGADLRADLGRAAPLGLGMIVLIPVLAGTLHASYQDVFGERPALPPAAAAKE